jgi:type IV secretory pathway TrbF-like protein
MTLDLSAAVEAAVSALVDQGFDSWIFNARYADEVTAAVLAAAAPIIEAQVRAQVAEEMAGLVQSLQALCDDAWLRRRDRLSANRYMRSNGAGEIEYAASMVRTLIEDLPDYDPIGTGGAYLTWLRNGRDEGQADS